MNRVIFSRIANRIAKLETESSAITCNRGSRSNRDWNRTHGDPGIEMCRSPSLVFSVISLERIAHVVQCRRLDDDAERADETRRREHPQKHPVQHHRHELPVLLHLYTWRTGSDRPRYSSPRYLSNYHQKTRSQPSQECKDPHRHCFCDTRDLNLWPFDPKINRFIGLVVEHLYFGDAWPLYGKNVIILQHLQSYRQSGASSKLFLNSLIQFSLN